MSFLPAQFVVRRWPWIVVAWLTLAIVFRLFAPRWDDVTFDGDLAFLPETMPSVVGEALLNEAFPERRSRSQIVIVIAREDAPLKGLDLQAADELAERFSRRIGDEHWGLTDVWTRHTEVVGAKLRSADKHAQLIILQFAHEFLAVRNVQLLDEVRREVADFQARPRGAEFAGLRFGVSGSAAVGGDLLGAAAESIRNTEWLTVALVVAVLLAVYRAPLLVMVPLVTIIVSLVISLGTLALLTKLNLLPSCEWWNFKVFKTTKIFIIVILYGSGTDFCLFLIARFREELALGFERATAITNALRSVADALIASALTTILGLATMFFAEFGKFRNSGPAIGVCLFITLIACLTLAPALLAAMGRYVMWPFHRGEQLVPSITTITWRDRFWTWITDRILRYPGTILLVSVAALSPLAWRGVSSAERVTYDLLSELSPERPTRQGNELLKRHFPVGEAGPIVVLVRKANAGLGGVDQKPSAAAMAAMSDLTERLGKVPGVLSVRSLAEPLGDRPKRLSLLTSEGRQKQFLQNHPRSKALFLAQGKLAGEVTRLELVPNVDPFALEAIDTLSRVDAALAAIRNEPNSFWSDATFAYAGATAGIRDLREVTRADQRRIQWAVTVAVLGVLLVILRRPAISLYLIASVVFSYLATIGATELFFQYQYGATFLGLDWKVPVFLFVILVAVGEDYNIYLATRVFEEQRGRGWFPGLREATIRTGGIITSCGLIMACTFVSMTSSQLRGMVELGFALSLGIVLDTFIVRPVLVPAFLALWGKLPHTQDA